MKIIHLCRRPVSMYVAVAFLAVVCFWASQSPAAPAAPAPDQGSSATMEEQQGSGTGFIETEEPTPPARKGKGFPWLIAAVVVVAGGAALYFFVLKKKNYTLTVNVGEGVTGTPAAGTSTNKKGTVINYNYSLQAGYSNLVVTLDGAAVAASGSVTMNANHTLAASATKTFVLTVTKGEHVNGTPETGVYTHPRGTNVSYNYSPASGYSNLEVKLDNVVVANSGTVAMNDNHTLTATLYGANIAVNSTPAGARIYIDNVDSGHNTPYTFTYSTAVTKAVHLRYSCGYKEYREVVSVALGQTKTVNRNLTPGIWEEFLIPASSCWHPYTPSNWTSLLELYRYIGTPTYFTTNYYSYSFVGDYSVSVHMNRKKGATTSSNSIFLGTGTTMTNASGYLFNYTCGGQYSIYRLTNYNFITYVGSATAIKSWTPSAAIQSGLNKFNVLKVIKTGSNYALNINSTLVFSFADATYNPGYLVLAFFGDAQQTEMQYNYVILTPGGASPMPAYGMPVTEAPTDSGKGGVGDSSQKGSLN